MIYSGSRDKAFLFQMMQFCFVFLFCLVVVGGLFLAIGKLPWIKMTDFSFTVAMFSIYKYVLRLWISSPLFFFMSHFMFAA